MEKWQWYHEDTLCLSPPEQLIPCQLDDFGGSFQAFQDFQKCPFCYFMIVCTPQCVFSTSPQSFAAQYSSSILRTSTMTNTNGDAIRTCIPPQSGTVISDSRSPRRIRQDHFWITDLAWRASISLEWFSKLVTWKENLYLLKVQEIIEEIELCYGRYSFSWKTRKGWRNSVTRWFTDDGWMNTSRRPSDQCGRFPEARPARRPNALACPARTLSSSIAPTFG